MKPAEDKSGQWILLFTVTYMVSYITRINYGAVIAAMEQSTGMPRSLLSMAVTGSFITYGVGQILSGFCGDRISPKKLIACGLAVTTLMNLLIPLCRSPYHMLAVWCVNGLAQSFLWPPLVLLMSALLTPDRYKTAAATVAWGSSFGTIAVYLAAPVLIAWFGTWKAVFIFSAVCGGVMLLIWNRFCCEIERPAAQSTARGGCGVLLSPVMAGVLLAIVLVGMLRDGVTTWMPSYIAETYRMSSAAAILTGVVLPIFAIFCLQAAAQLYRKRLTNPLLCAGVLFCGGMAASLALALFSGRNAALSVLFSAALTGCMHGTNLMLVSMLPPFFQKYGNISTVSGILNACTYIGSALSTYGIALLSERLGWQAILLIWLLTAAAGTVICFACVRPWRRYME